LETVVSAIWAATCLTCRFGLLDLKYPLTVEAEGPPVHPESTPLWEICHWEFPARGNLPPVKLTWYDGDKRPALQEEHNMPDYPKGTLFVGAEGMLIADYGRSRTVSQEKFAELRTPAARRFPNRRGMPSSGWRPARPVAQPAPTSAIPGL
jgi:hypothetical protein